jgi:choline dehydrogenase
VEHFDYVIVGAGSAGCVLANRLTADGAYHVCLLEAGGANRHPYLHIPAGWAANFNNPRVDWGYQTEPEPNLGGRPMYWPRGKVLGGSSAINGMVYIRGVPEDFEAWAQQGATGWSWEEVLPYFRKAEHQQIHYDEFHGADGPLHVEDVRDKRGVHDAFIDAMVQLGMPPNPDFNGARQAGAGYHQFTQHRGRRWSTASAYLRPARARNNLRIKTRTLAQRVVFDGRRVAGVDILERGRPGRLCARRVLLCGGAVNSPQLLELSGIGGAARLTDLGIPVVLDAPDVGEHLQDHILVRAVFGTHPEASINREVQGLRLVPAALNWLLRRQGPLTTGSAPVGAFWYSREGLEGPPDLQIHFASGATIYSAEGHLQPMEVPAMTAVVNQSRPESRGSIHIASADPAAHPEIRPNYLATDLDRRTLLAGLRLLLRIFGAPALAPYVTGRLAPEPALDTDSDDALMAYVRADANTVYHPTSTCSIGKVVDPQLAVVGVEGLYVADASVMPNVVSGNTNAATIMVAEKAAELLLADA